MKECPECKGKLYCYVEPESTYSDMICWKCGHYESDSPAFQKCPWLFANMVRENPVYYLKKYAKTPILNKDKNNYKTPTDEQNYSSKHLLFEDRKFS